MDQLSLADLVGQFRRAKVALRRLDRKANEQPGAISRTTMSAIQRHTNTIDAVSAELYRRGQTTTVEALHAEAYCVYVIAECRRHGQSIPERVPDELGQARAVLRFKLKREAEQAERARAEVKIDEASLPALEAEFQRLLSGEDGQTRQLTMAEEKAMGHAQRWADQGVSELGIEAFSPRWYGRFIQEYNSQLPQYRAMYQTEADDLHEAWLDAQGAEDDEPMFTLEYVAETSINGISRRVPFTCAGEFGLDQLDYQVELLFEGSDVHEITIKRVDPECR